MLKILAIDPGYDRCGLAVLKKDRGEQLIFSDCLTTRSGDPYPERLLAIGQGIERALTRHQPDLVAVEKLFFAANRKTAGRVSEVRGLIIYLAAKHDLPVVEYTPLEIKETVAGFGRAGKKQVAEMVARLIKLPVKKYLDDELDAVAVGLTAAARYLPAAGQGGYPHLNRKTIAKEYPLC